MTNNGRAALPRRTSTAWLVVRNLVLARLADNRDTEGRVSMGSKAGAASRLKIGIAVDDKQAQPGHASEHGPHWRQLPQVELAGPVRQHRGNQHRPLRQHSGEDRIRGNHGGRTRAAGRQIVHICGREHFRAAIVHLHPARMTH